MKSFSFLRDEIVEIDSRFRIKYATLQLAKWEAEF